MEPLAAIVFFEGFVDGFAERGGAGTPPVAGFGGNADGEVGG